MQKFTRAEMNYRGIGASYRGGDEGKFCVKLIPVPTIWCIITAKWDRIFFGEIFTTSERDAIVAGRSEG